MITSQTRSDKGVTLIELLVVLVIAAVLVGGIYTLFMTQQRSYSVQDQVTGVQQDARVALTFMARDIRMAGMAVGAGSGTGFTDGTNPPFAINGLFNYAVNPTNSTTAPDDLTVVLGVEEWGVVTDPPPAGNVVTLDSPVDSSANYVAFDLLPGRLFNASNADDGDNTITVVNVPSGDKTIGGKAYGVKAITYSVGADGILRRNENTGAGAEPLAGDGTTTFVEDLQFAYQVDGDVTNWYNDPLTDFPAGMTAANISMVRINITVRTAVQDATVQDEVPTAQFNQPPLEDHTNPADLNGPDGFRRRVHQTVVKVRNI
jgi:prepilin-type N-terminal cleavage/methylation domain-containing protein